MSEMAAEADGADPMKEYREAHGSGLVNTRISDREDKYHSRHRAQRLSPERGGDAFSGETPSRSYAEIMRETELAREKSELLRKLEKQKRDGTAVPASAVAAAVASAAAAASMGAAGSARAVAPAPATPADSASSSSSASAAGGATARKRRRWDDTSSVGGGSAAAGDSASTVAGSAVGHVDASDAASAVSTSGITTARAPAGNSSGGGGRWESGADADGDSDAAATDAMFESASVAAPGGGAGRRNRWDATPATASDLGSETPGRLDAFSMAEAGAAASGGAAGRKRSRWDETPAPSGAGGDFGATPSVASGSATPAGAGAYGATPAAGYDGATPTPSQLLGAQTPAVHLMGASGGGAGAAGGSFMPATPEQRVMAELQERNRPLSDDELDGMLPPKGFKVLEPPGGYVPLRTPSRKLLATPTPMATPGFRLTETPARDAYGVPPTPSEVSGAAGAGAGALPFIRPEDLQYFGKLTDGAKEEDLTHEELKERRIMALLLKIKNGTPPQRKVALKALSDKARELGAGPLFNQLLPLLMSPQLEDQERHVLVKVVDRVLFRLDELVRPYVHKILVVIEPMLIDEDFYARVEGREIIANLAKAAGLATMIATMRPDIDSPDEYVRNTTSRAFAVVASALGVPALLPFLKAVCGSKKSWQARHTGLKIVQQMAILQGSALLPHTRMLVETVGPALGDDQQKVRIMAALALAALAEAAAPYGIESFDSVLRPLWKGIRAQRGKALAAFIKAIGFIIPLMDAEYAAYYTKEVMVTLLREFASPDEEMKKIVLKATAQCCCTEGVDAGYVKAEVLPEFFRSFWVRRMALDRRNFRALVDCTVALGDKVGAGEILGRIVEDLKDESEPYRRMVMETVERVVSRLGASDVEPRLEEQLVDGILYAFQEQTTAAEGFEGGANAASAAGKVMLSGFATVVAALGARCKPYLPQIAGTIKWRLNNKSPLVRMQAADLLGRIAGVMRVCGEDALLGHLGVVLYECLGEEFPDVLGSILGGLKGIVNVIGMHAMQPPVKDLLPRLTPILKNRSEKVQENAIDLVGRIADRGAEFVGAREWMRITFELLELLKAQRKAIRRACVNTFGYIAKAIGPQDVMHALLNNLKVQERQNRVCTTVAIAIVAETCQPFTVLPALLNEYRTPELTVQTGVLKALSFMFEYIGPSSRDYVYAVTPLLEDALMDRDLVHRQTACWAVKHLALGLQGAGAEDALQHLLNFVWPNILEASPHVIQAVFEAVEALRVSLGPARLWGYVLQGLWHPARRVREVFWKVYNNLYVYSADALTPLYPRLPVDTVVMSAQVAGSGAGASSSGGAGDSEAAAKAAHPKRYHNPFLDLVL